MAYQRTTEIVLIAALVLVCATPTKADELILKNGQKIVGSVVGFERGMFRVETEYGMALVRKDKVVSIQVSSSAPASGQGTTGDKATSPSAAQSVAPDRSSSEQAPAQMTAPAVPETAPPRATPTQVSRPLEVPIPAHLEEHVEGITYINDTFQFTMFKPPGWKIFEGLPGETGYGIMAMGTEDERTILIVDRQVWSGKPNLKSERIEGKLRQTYQDYRQTPAEAFNCDGLPAIRRTFQGVLDGSEWHGLIVRVANGNTVFGLIGLTSAEMSGFQQAVLNKIIKSLHFLSSTEQPAASNPPSPTF